MLIASFCGHFPRFSFAGSVPKKKMKWKMQMEEVEAILEKIWDLHDKLSDAIHSISRSHFLTSIKTLQNSPHNGNITTTTATDPAAVNAAAGGGFVFVKDFRPVNNADGDGDDESAVREAKSLNAIRTALENLEDQLEFFHTIQTQQRVERDAAIARLEQSRIVLAMTLAEHRGKKYKVIEEALAFVGDVHDASCLDSPEVLYGQPNCSSGNFVEKGKRSNILTSVFISSFNFVRKALGLDHMGGIVGNAALVAVSMIALLHLQQVNEHPFKQESRVHNRPVNRTTQLGSSSSNAQSSHLDVLLARG